MFNDSANENQAEKLTYMLITQPDFMDMLTCFLIALAKNNPVAVT